MSYSDGDKVIQEDAISICKETLSLLELSGGWIKQTSGAPRFRTLWKQNDPSVTESSLYMIKDFSEKGDPLMTTPTFKHGLIQQGPWNSDQEGGYAHLHSYEETPSKKFCIDLWSDERGLKRRYDITGCDLHGPAYTDSEFSALSFSENGEYLVYVAESKIPNGVSFYKENIKDSEVRGGVYDYKESWGEQLEQCYTSVLCVLHLKSGDVQVLQTPSDVFCAKPAWSGNNIIYFIGFDLSCMKLGGIYCWNRRSRLYSYNVESGTVVAHTPPGKTVTMPSPGPDGKVAFLMCEAGGPHRKYMDVCVLSSGDDTVQVVPHSLFFGALSLSPWVDASHIVLSSCEGATQQIYKVNIHDGTKENIAKNFNNKGVFSFSVLDQIGNNLLFSFSHLSPLSDIYKQGVAYLDLSDPDKLLYLTPPHSSKRSCNYSLKSFEREGRPYNGILAEPAKDVPDLQTLIVFPHGGPHALFTTQFQLQAYTFARLGYSTLMVNYTGSLGLGPDSVYELVGNVGDMDVKDVHHAAMQVASSFKHVAVMGGSHGGFLTAHLIGQFPDFYKVAALRNPVIDISAMVGVSDIPDWCYTETGMEYDSICPPVPQVSAVSTMLDKSPIRYVDQVKCPALLLIGGKDLRVPPSQGIRYYKYLKSRGVECHIKFYPEDCHPLSGVPCTADWLLQIHFWFQKHLQLSQ